MLHVPNSSTHGGASCRPLSHRPAGPTARNLGWLRASKSQMHRAADRARKFWWMRASNANAPTSPSHCTEFRVTACLKSQLTHCRKIENRCPPMRFPWLTRVPSYRSHRARPMRSRLVRKPHQTTHRFLQICPRQRPPPGILLMTDCTIERWRTYLLYLAGAIPATI